MCFGGKDLSYCVESVQIGKICHDHAVEAYEEHSVNVHQIPISHLTAFHSLV